MLRLKKLVQSWKCLWTKVTRFKREDTLAILDARRIKAQIIEGKARLTTARNLLLQRKAEVSRAQSDYEMKAKLRPSNAVSQSTLLDSEKALAVAKSQADSALEGIAEGESRLELLNIRLNDLKVTAPFKVFWCRKVLNRASGLALDRQLPQFWQPTRSSLA